jgi:hypothetical protein
MLRIKMFSFGTCRSLTLVDLAEYYDTRELGLGIVGNLWVESEDAHATPVLGGYVFVGFLDQHGELLELKMCIGSRLLLYDVSG